MPPDCFSTERDMKKLKNSTADLYYLTNIRTPMSDNNIDKMLQQQLLHTSIALEAIRETMQPKIEIKCFNSASLFLPKKIQTSMTFKWPKIETCIRQKTIRTDPELLPSNHYSQEHVNTNNRIRLIKLQKSPYFAT